MLFPILYSIGLLIIVPAFVIISLWKTSFKSKLEWILDALSTTVIIVLIFQVGNWGIVGYYIRFLWFILLIIALILSWKRLRSVPFTTKYKVSQKLSIGVYVVLLLLFGTYNAFIITSYTVNDEAIELTFPLQDGTYYVGQGGNHVFMNYHQAHPPQKYAIDILEVNIFGFRAKGIYPKDLNKYNIYARELYSPCDGTVLETENHSQDLIPPDSDPENPFGNFVAISCENNDATIYLAHMKKGSVAVVKGDKIKTGDLLGNVGNTGNTSEPHLHIHAEKDLKGIPIKFNGRFLVRNSLIR